MRKIDRHIEIVRAGTSRLSSMSRQSGDAILAVLSEHYVKVGITTVHDLSDLEALVASKPDLVFVGMKFIPVHPHLSTEDPEKIWVSAYLDEQGVAYTGSSQLAHQLECDKPLAKQRALDAGLKTSPFYVARQEEPQTKRDTTLTFPLFVKPTNRGGGIGIDGDSIVYNLDELRSKVERIAGDLQANSLIEEYLPGREFSVAVLKDLFSAQYAVMPIEKIAPKDEHGKRILTQRVKSADSVRDAEVTDAVITSEITTLALNIFEALGARDYGRVDIRLDAFGVPHFLEANLLPSLIKGYGSFPKACMLNRNLDYDTMILHIVELGLSRAKLLNEGISESSPAGDSVLPLFEIVFEPKI